MARAANPTANGTEFIAAPAEDRIEPSRLIAFIAMFFGMSITSCMASATSEPGGAGLGTVGLNGELLESMARDAGFTRFVVHDVDDPANLYYEVRP